MLDPPPQHLTLLPQQRLQPHLQHQLQRLRHRSRISIPTENLPPPTTGVVEPSLNEMQHLSSDVATIAALEGRFGVVEQGFQDGKEGFVGDVEVEEEIDDPGGRADAALVFERVALE